MKQPNSDISKTSIFLSYARNDDELFVERLHDDLAARAFRVWLDRVSMPNRGLTFSQEIRDAIDAADRFVLVAGEVALRSDYVRAEWEYALSQCKPINIALRRCEYKALPPKIAHFDAPDFRNDADYLDRLKILIRQLNDTPAPLAWLSAVPELPNNFLPRPADMAKLHSLVIADAQFPTVITAEKRMTALEGMGGIGKSVLASAFAHECDVRRAFPDGIIWLKVGQQPSLQGLYQEVGAALGVTLGNDITNEPVSGKIIQNVLHKKRCLIILDDAWNQTAVKAFRDLVSGLSTQLLITTRSQQMNDILGAREYRLGLLDELQSVALLQSWIGRDDPHLAQVAKQLGYLPLALKIAGARMLRGGLTGLEYASQFDRVSRMKVDRKTTDRDENLDVSITVGVEAVLGGNEAEKLLYYTLGLFPIGASIPQATIVKLWKHLRPNVGHFDLEETLAEFVDYELAEQRENNTIALHDLLHSYAKENLGDQYVKLQNLLLIASNPGGTVWHSLREDGYLRDHLCFHLIEAKRQGELYALLTSNPDWFWAKITQRLGRSTFLHDVQLAIDELPDPLNTTQIVVLAQLYAAQIVAKTYIASHTFQDLIVFVALGNADEATSIAHAYPLPIQQIDGLLTVFETLQKLAITDIEVLLVVDRILQTDNLQLEDKISAICRLALAWNSANNNSKAHELLRLAKQLYKSGSQSVDSLQTLTRAMAAASYPRPPDLFDGAVLDHKPQERTADELWYLNDTFGSHDVDETLRTDMQMAYYQSALAWAKIGCKEQAWHYIHEIAIEPNRTYNRIDPLKALLVEMIATKRADSEVESILDELRQLGANLVDIANSVATWRISEAEKIFQEALKVETQEEQRDKLFYSYAIALAQNGMVEQCKSMAGSIKDVNIRLEAYRKIACHLLPFNTAQARTLLVEYGSSKRDQRKADENDVKQLQDLVIKTVRKIKEGKKPKLKSQSTALNRSIMQVRFRGYGLNYEDRYSIEHNIPSARKDSDFQRAAKEAKSLVERLETSETEYRGMLVSHDPYISATEKWMLVNRRRSELASGIAKYIIHFCRNRNFNAALEIVDALPIESLSDDLSSVIVGFLNEALLVEDALRVSERIQDSPLRVGALMATLGATFSIKNERLYELLSSQLEESIMYLIDQKFGDENDRTENVFTLASLWAESGHFAHALAVLKPKSYEDFLRALIDWSPSLHSFDAKASYLALQEVLPILGWVYPMWGKTYAALSERPEK